MICMWKAAWLPMPAYRHSLRFAKAVKPFRF